MNCMYYFSCLARLFWCGLLFLLLIHETHETPLFLIRLYWPFSVHNGFTVVLAAITLLL